MLLPYLICQPEAPYTHVPPIWVITSCCGRHQLVLVTIPVQRIAYLFTLLVLFAVYMYLFLYIFAVYMFLHTLLIKPICFSSPVACLFASAPPTLSLCGDEASSLVDGCVMSTRDRPPSTCVRHGMGPLAAG